MRDHRVVTLAFSGGSFELSVASEVFALSRPELDVDRWYEFVLCSSDGQPLEMAGGFRIEVAHSVEAVRTADTVVVAGAPADRDVPADVLAAIGAAAESGARIVSICSGAFVLGRAGLLDGRRATTHWRHAEDLAVRHPSAHIDPDALYVQDGPVLTSAGTAAGIDALLHLVRTDHGAHVANQVARRMVVPPHRDGGQRQYVEEPVAPPVRDPISATMEWALERLDRPLAVTDLARHAHLSPRQLTRRFRDEAGLSPGAWLARARVVASMALLETSDVPVERVGERVGIPSAASFRRRFAAEVGMPPSEYRRRFRDRDDRAA